MKNISAAARRNMLDSQIKPFSVTDEAILDAFATVAREDFVPSDLQGLAYTGEDLPLGQGRCLIEPAAYARLLQGAGLNADDTVLDVGCLTGYTSALLARVAKAVVAVDETEWVAKAKKNVGKTDSENVIFTAAALTEGCSQHSPYDLIVINGSVQTIPQALVNQLKDGGRIATFFRGDNGECHAVSYRKHKGDLRKQVLFDAFVPLLDAFMKPEGFVF